MRRVVIVIRQAAIAVIITLLPFGTCEFLIEMALRHPRFVPDRVLPYLRDYYFSEDQPYIQYLSACARYDPKLFYTLRPGECRFVGREFDTLVRVNSLGVRDDEASLEAPTIIVTGDSIAMGWGVGDGGTFADIIERASGTRVLNVAVSSYGTARELEILNRVDTSRLKLLIIQYSPNDLEENLTYLSNNGELPISSESLYDQLRDEHLQATKYYLGKHLLWLAREMISEYPQVVSMSKPDDRQHTEAFLQTLERFLSRTDKIPRDVVIAVMASKELDGKLVLPNTGKELISFPYPSGSESYLRLDSHLSASGHEKIAYTVLRLIEQTNISYQR